MVVVQRHMPWILTIPNCGTSFDRCCADISAHWPTAGVGLWAEPLNAHRVQSGHQHLRHGASLGFQASAVFCFLCRFCRPLNPASDVSSQRRTAFVTLPQLHLQVTHMPPELLSEGRLSKAADVYSFGVMLWEMCALLLIALVLPTCTP